MSEIDLATIAAAPALAPDHEHPAVTEVQRFLDCYGYLDAGRATPGLLDDPTSAGLEAYQRFHSLPVTGAFDVAVRDLMVRPRCGLRDLDNGIAFQVVAKQDHLDLTFAFGQGTADVGMPNYLEFDLVRKALFTWADTGHFAFHEVREDDDPDIHFAWVAPGDPGYDFERGVLGTAEYPGTGTHHVRFNDRFDWYPFNLPAGPVDVETVAVHEMGHVLGLGHSSVVGSVMQPENDPVIERRTLHADDLAALDELYGPRPNDLASAVIFPVRQHFGDESQSLPGTWMSSSAEYAFELPRVDVRQTAYLMFQARAVTSEHNLLTVNGQPIPGGIPTTAGGDGWAGQIMLIPPHLLQPGENTLRVETRDASGTSTGDLDDFVLDNAVVLYSTIRPGLFTLPPAKWPGGLPGRAPEPADPIMRS